MSLMTQVAGVLKTMAKDFNVAVLVRMTQSFVCAAFISQSELCTNTLPFVVALRSLMKAKYFLNPAIEGVKWNPGVSSGSNYLKSELINHAPKKTICFHLKSSIYAKCDNLCDGPGTIALSLFLFLSLWSVTSCTDSLTWMKTCCDLKHETWCPLQVTNHVTRSSSRVQPGLGVSWRHVPRTRILLERVEKAAAVSRSSMRSATLIKSSRQVLSAALPLSQYRSTAQTDCCWEVKCYSFLFKWRRWSFIWSFTASV